jgi:hypothetical protein
MSAVLKAIFTTGDTEEHGGLGADQSEWISMAVVTCRLGSLGWKT